MSCHPGGHWHPGWGFAPQHLADRQLEDLKLEVQQISGKRSAKDSGIFFFGGGLKTIYLT